MNGLTPGQTLTDTFTYTVSDGHGGTATTTVTITINGANEPPVANPDRNTVTEDTTTTATGNVITPASAGDQPDSDPDGGTLTVVGVVAGTVAPNGTPPTGNVGGGVVGTYGSVTIQDNGSYTYALDNDKPEVQALAVGETLTDVFTYTCLLYTSDAADEL